MPDRSRTRAALDAARAWLTGRGPGELRLLGLSVVAVMLGAGTAVLVVRAGGDDRRPPRAAASPTATATVSPTPEPTPSPTPELSPTAAASPTRAMPGALRTRASDGTLTAYVFRRPGSPPLEAGAENSVVSVDVRDTARGRMSFVVDYGDGTRDTEDWAYGRPHPPRCVDTVNFAPTWPHRYRRAGRYVVRVTVRTLACGAPAGARPNTVTVALPVVVARDVDTHNGPAQPAAYPQNWRSDHFDEPDLDWAMYVDVSGSDDDGFVRRVAIDFGDGSAPAVYEFPLTECAPVRDRYPRTSFDQTRRADLSSRHEYPVAGTYQVRTTVESTDCEGAEVQRRTLTTEFRSAGRPPS